MNRAARRAPAPLGILKPAALLIVLLWVLTGCGSDSASDGTPAQTAAKTQPVRGTIVAMGDSLTAGLGVDPSEAYPARLRAKLSAAGYPFEVVNAGVSGETSSGALARIDWVISALKPDLIILETGANDGLRGIEPEVLRKNLDRIVGIIKADGIAVILCGMRMLPNLGPVYTRQFAGVYPQIAAKYDIPLIPFFLEGVAGDPHYNQADGIHPIAAGYRRIVDYIYPYVLAAVEKLPAKNRIPTAPPLSDKQAQN